jgi:hypothetical protein
MGKSVVLGALAAAGVVVLAGCQQSEVTRTPDRTPAASSAPPASSAPATSSAPAQRTAGVGSTITLKGSGDGEQVATTLVTVVDPAPPADEYSTPGAGNRLVAVQFRLRNTGTAPYDDSPANGAKVLDAQGHQFESSFLDTKAGPSLPSQTRVAPGGTALGYITFEVPKTAKITGVQFGLNSGLADQTGEWTLG